MKSKLFKYVFRSFGALVVVGIAGCIIVLMNFQIFDTPDQVRLDVKCDYEGLRQAQTYRIDGNAVTRPSINVSVQVDCTDYDSDDERLVFTADNSSIHDDDVRITWLTFDTLSIAYKKGLRIFKQENKVSYNDATLNVYVVYIQVD